MTSFYLVKTIAKFEIRTLLRSWFFRIFVGLAVFGLGIFNIVLNVEQSGAPWIYKALAASIPYANLIILNLGQAIVAVLLASEFLKQDKKNDSVEVIYVRSISNFEYILGKTLGILSVFFLLNILVLLIGTGFSFLNNAATINFFAYLVYPLLISLPTLIFIFGLSFFMMVLIKNQAVTFILLLGYIALTVFYLNKKAFHVFDFIAYSVPMMFSSITGFSDLNEILLHRGIYLLIGIGLILLTVYKLQRLPQHPRLAAIPLITGLFFLLAGGFLVQQYLGLKEHQIDRKKEFIALNNYYAFRVQSVVKTCSIDLNHLGDKISAIVHLEIQNQQLQTIDTLVFSLNPSLTVSKVLLNDKQTNFNRKSHLLFIKLPQGIQPGEIMHLQMAYEGTIDETVCFLDQSPEEYEDIFSEEVFTIRKRYAFLQKDFVCLTSESLWYPVAGTGFTTRNPMKNEQDFVDFSLKVKTRPGLTVVSQGIAKPSKNGITEFKTEYALPKLCLLIGNYIAFHIKVDSVEYSIYTTKGNEFFLEHFKNISDTLPQLIRNLKQDYELALGLKYPFRRFSFAEVPIHFATENHWNSGISEAIQPEIILYPEKGVRLESTDFRNRNYYIKQELKQNKEEALPEEIQSRMFRSAIQINFLQPPTSWKSNSYSVFPLFYTYVLQLHSEKWPVLNTAFEAYFKNRNYNSDLQFSDYQELKPEEKVNIELSKSSLDEWLKKEDPFRKGEKTVSLNEIVLYKGKQLLDMMRAKFGEKEMDTLLTGLYTQHLHQKISFEELNSSIQSKFKINFDSVVNNWLLQKNIPGFRVQDVTTYKVVVGEDEKYQVRMKITNAENVDGLVTLNFELNKENTSKKGKRDNGFNVDFSRKVYIAANSSLEIGYTFNTEPARMMIETHISKNLPCVLNFNFSGFTETRKNPALDGFTRIGYLSSMAQKNEIIVDNEDPGFSFNQLSQIAYLKSLIRKENSNSYKYDRIRWWNPPSEWKAVLGTKFYGTAIQSAYYTKGSDGNQVATWKAYLPEQGEYEVYYYLDKVDIGWRRNNKPPDYNFIIYHDGIAERIKRNSDELDEGWVLLGTFNLDPDTARVQLTNKSVGNFIIADAVKWVKIK